jgi:hypothetical protein
MKILFIIGECCRTMDELAAAMIAADKIRSF